MKVLLFLFQNLGAILSGIQAVEAAFGPGNGATKKQMVLNAIQAAAQDGEAIPEDHVKAISTLIDSTVSTLNATGLLGFGKKQ